MNPAQAYDQLNKALHDLFHAILNAFGRQGLNGFLPGALKFMKDQELASARDLLRLTMQAMQDRGVPPILGEPYMLHMTPTLLGYLIVGNGWIPDRVPALPAGASGSTEDVEGALVRVIEARAVLKKAVVARGDDDLERD